MFDWWGGDTRERFDDGDFDGCGGWKCSCEGIFGLQIRKLSAVRWVGEYI